MMNPAPVFDRVYAGLKQLLRDGAIAPGDRLDPASLAERLVASITPVRDALHRLAGERLADTGSEGFTVPKTSEPDLRDLYAWNQQLLRLTLQTSLSSRFADDRGDVTGSVAERTERLFSAIAARSSNREHAFAIGNINDRLHAIRRIEPAVLSGVDDEYHALAEADLRSLRNLLGSYHRRRIAAVPQLVRALHRGPN
jgi:hypothetical protein